MREHGLVFAGGGGKGAYQIGVWKYLREIGLDQRIRVVSGTSVGALNAALFLGSDYETAERIWLNIDRSHIIPPKEITREDVSRWIKEAGIIISGPLILGPLGIPMMHRMLKNKMTEDSMFSRDGMEKMIREGIDFPKLRSPSTSCFATCFSYRKGKTEAFRLNDYSHDEITTLLLASSAIPIAFPAEQFRNRNYCDGGLPIIGENVPVQPIYDMGIRDIIVVHLSKDDRPIKQKKYPGARIIEVFPSQDLGGFRDGTMDFSAKSAAIRLNRGYLDAQKTIGNAFVLMQIFS